MAKTIWVKITGYAIIAFIVLTLIFLILENIFRQIPEYAKTGFSYDQHTIWRLTRNLTSTKAYAMGKLHKEPFKLKFNKQGFRGEDFTPEKSGGGVTRIMFLGDSYTAGLDYPHDETFIGILEQQFAATNRNIEILNASCPAWGTGQEYAYWVVEGKHFNPDYIILVVAPNDIRECYNKKLIVLDEVNRLQLNKPYIPGKERLFWKLSNLSSTFQFVQKSTDRDYGSFRRIFQYFVVNYGKEDETNWDLPIFLKEPFEEVRASYRLNEAIISDLNDKTKETDTQLLLTVIPSRIEFSGELDTAKHQAGIVAEHLQRVATANSIPFLNTFQEAASLDDPLDLYMDWEFHFDPDGHQFMADQLYAFILEHLSEE